MDDPMLVAARRAVLEALEQRRGLIAFSKIEALEMDRLARQYEVTALERLRGELDRLPPKGLAMSLRNLLERMDDQLKDLEAQTGIAESSRRLPRVDGKEKVTAAARYTEDLRLPGLLHARLLLSPHPHARIVRVAKEAALAVEGVVAVLLAEDLPIAEDATREEHLLLASGEARFTGHPVAAVLAENEKAAADGVDAL